ncbi:MAG: DUF7033 domain-containing protein [Flavobacteriaceae bacterium]
MILVYVPKKNTRILYTFKHIFEGILQVGVSLTNNLQEFVAYSGVKFSYSQQPLGNELFFEAHPLLFELGVAQHEIHVQQWEGLAVFFKTSTKSAIPFDLFAASFYLLSRYEEYQPHQVDSRGRFQPEQSLAYRHQFLEQPLVDLWAVKILDLLREQFPDFQWDQKKHPTFQAVFSIVSPYKFKLKSPFLLLWDLLGYIFRFQFWELRDFWRVRLNNQVDPYGDYPTLRKIIQGLKHPPLLFFLFTPKGPNDDGVSPFNPKYKALVKENADYIPTSLMVAYESQINAGTIPKEIKLFNESIHRSVKSVVLHRGIRQLGETYIELSEAELQNDYSMCYTHYIGYRASTAVPFYFYDLTHERLTYLKIHPVVATEEALKQLRPKQAFDRLNQLFDRLPTSSAQFCVHFSNKIMNYQQREVEWRRLFIKFIERHATAD